MLGLKVIFDVSFSTKVGEIFQHSPETLSLLSWVCEVGGGGGCKVQAGYVHKLVGATLVGGLPSGYLFD
jgi:hypothetical protein